MLFFCVIREKFKYFDKRRSHDWKHYSSEIVYLIEHAMMEKAHDKGENSLWL